MAALLCCARSPLFVTWKKGEAQHLRGCIGTLEPKPLVRALNDYSLTRWANYKAARLLRADAYCDTHPVPCEAGCTLIKHGCQLRASFALYRTYVDANTSAMCSRLYFDQAWQSTLCQLCLVQNLMRCKRQHHPHVILQHFHT